ncbi:MAG TPA: carboxypeptidase regulatory-like domain-containing protein [Gemmatimonadales bacterium]|nr:carboxypeptidase regulatory-like domain-containing protein [Gemmatimonadales bacterium]
MAEPTRSNTRHAGHRRRWTCGFPRAVGRIGCAHLRLVAAVIVFAAPLSAQSVTGAAIAGRVLTTDSTPLEQAIVRVTNTSNGERWQTTTSARGTYFVDYLSVGGPYRVEVRAVGYEPAQRDSIRLALGQRLTLHFTLAPAPIELQEIAVTAPVEARSIAARSGPSQVISDSLIARLPIPRRDYTDLARLSPQVTRSVNGGLSFAGQHDRYNSIQIDGTNNSDPFGRSFSGNGTPGWAVGLTAFTPEAVKEIQVLSAPFDVRYSGFAGGLINAVSRSGSNQVEGSVLSYFEARELAGADSTGSRGEDFSRREFGLTFGAPIVHDRVALFLNAATRQEVVAQSVPVPVPAGSGAGGPDQLAPGISYESLARFRDLLRGRGVNPGGFSAASSRTPSRSLFAKVTAQLGVNNRLAVSHNYGHGNAQLETDARSLDVYPLSSTGSDNPETINATRVAWTTAFGSRFSNELILARVDDQRTCLPNSDFPTVSVFADGGEVAAGVLPRCIGLETGHTLWEITDNIGMAAGNHQLTFGTHAERVDLVDDVLFEPGGHWSFDSLDSLAMGQASGYARDFPVAGVSQVAFRVNQVGAYLQDQWQPTPRLTLTTGIRLDVPFVPIVPTQNAAALRDLGINTALTPSGNVLWSPRFGVNYDVSGRGTTVLRGGAGLFAGHPAYVWFRNVYGSTGIRAQSLQCEGDEVPAFTLDPAHQPTSCDGAPARSISLAYFDPDFRFPRTLKLSLGADHRLPGGIIATLDFLYSRGVNAVQIVDMNLRGPVGISSGEGGRVLYGSIDPSNGVARPDRPSDDLRGVYQLQNGSGDRSYSFTVQLSKLLLNGTGLSAAYTYTDTQDRMSMDGNIADINLGATPVNGTLAQRELRTSLWERPHKVTVVGTANLPLGFGLGLTYIGMSGAPFTYVATGDPNADGFRPTFEVSNDVVYVPRSAADISFANPADWDSLDPYIRNEPCLQRQRGHLVERNSCRDPWIHETQARLSKRFQIAGRHAFEITADLFNVLNFISGDWGLVRHTVGDVGNTVPLLDLLGYDVAKGRGVYAFLPVNRSEIDLEASRWRLQLGASLSF